VPHGGYVTSCFQQVALAHFSTTLAQQNQNHTIIAHLEFVRRTQVGLAQFIVKDVKLGRQTSTIHITLCQNEREEIFAYITNSNLETELGPSFPTGWSLYPPPRPADLRKLIVGTDEEWTEMPSTPYPKFRRAANHVQFFLPRKGQPLKSIIDQWIRFRNGERFTNETLGFIADMFQQPVEAYHDGNDPFQVRPVDAVKKGSKSDPKARYWYPTLVLNLDVKKKLRQEGVEWLFTRCRAKQIQNGRYDLEIIVLDETGDIVAVSHHVAMVLDSSRNLAERQPLMKGKI
jgi:hypothetical protein